jgi:hypothetical protein
VRSGGSHHIPAVGHISEQPLYRPGLGYICKATFTTDNLADLAADFSPSSVPELQQRSTCSCRTLTLMCAQVTTSSGSKHFRASTLAILQWLRSTPAGSTGVKCWRLSGGKLAVRQDQQTHPAGAACEGHQGSCNNIGAAAPNKHMP